MAAQRAIVIAGGAFAGLALALALRQGLGPEIPVIVADPALATRPSRDPRASAIVAACRRLFETLGVWETIAEDTQPILDMVITDSRLEDAVRPTFLTFSGDVAPGEPFAHMVENRHLIDALTQRAEREGVELRPLAVSDYASHPEGISVTFSDGVVVEAAANEANDAAACGHPVVEARAQHQHTALIQMAGGRQGVLTMAVWMHDQAGGGAMPERRDVFAIYE